MSSSLSAATAAAEAAGAKPVLIGVDIGGTNVHAGVVGLDGELLATTVTPIGENFAVEAVVLKIVAAVKEALATAAVDVARDSGAATGSQVRAIGVGVGVPGVCDFPKGVVCGLANIPQWKNVPLARLISAQLGGIPSCLDNDATCAAAAEFWVGAGRSGRKEEEKARSSSSSLPSLVVVTLGTGIGTGMVDNGKVIRGRGLAGELGHMIMDMSEDALQCGCGQKGCLETVCSATGIARMYNTRAAGKLRCLTRDDFKTNGGGSEAAPSKPAASSAPEPVSCAEVFSRLGAGEALAAEVVDHCCEWLAVACLNISRAYDPDYIVFAGGVAKAGSALFDRVRAAYTRREGAVFRSLPGGSPAIVEAQAGEHCGILGAAYVVLEAIQTGTALV